MFLKYLSSKRKIFKVKANTAILRNNVAVIYIFKKDVTKNFSFNDKPMINSIAFRRLTICELRGNKPKRYIYSLCVSVL